MDRTTDDLGCTRPSKQERFSSLIHSQRRKRKREGGEFGQFILDQFVAGTGYVATQNLPELEDEEDETDEIQAGKAELA